MPQLDPYRPPASALVPDGTPRRSRRLAWKIYAFALAVISVPGYVALLVMEPGPPVFLEAGMTCTGLLGLFAYAFQRRLFSRPFWSLFAIALPAHDAVSLFVIRPSDNLVLSVALLGLSVPSYVAVALYAFRSPERWASAPEAA